MAKPVGKLKKINLNEVWANEVDGFASWLQQEEILEMLGEAFELTLKPAGGVEIENADRGKHVSTNQPRARDF